MATTTNYGWTTPDDTALVKDGASAIRTLGSSVDTTTKNLNPETTLGDMSFRSSTSNVNTRIPIGSSGQHLTVVAGVPTWATASDQTPLTTKGDLFTFSTLDARLGVGANNTILTADSAEATGLKWAAPAASGGMTLISETVASANSSISFSSLGSYKQLMLIWHGIRHSDANSAFSLRFNSSSSSNYNIMGLQTAGTALLTTAGALPALNGYNTTTIYTFGAGTNNAYNGTDSMGCILIDNYTSATKFKNYTANIAYYDASANAYRSINGVGFFSDTTAITSLDITRLVGTGTISNDSNTTIRLYGIQ